MAKEQEAIEMLEDIKNNTWTTKYIMSSDSAKAEIVLNMLKEKDKEIDSMSKFMVGALEDNVFNEICKKSHCTYELIDNTHFGARRCNKCIKKFFERKVDNANR